MMIVPKRKAIREKLNTYYVDVQRFIEHQQGQIDSGALHLASESSEGVVFFDRNNLIGGLLEENGHVFFDEDAVKRIFEVAGEYGFTLNIHPVDPEQVFFWAKMVHADLLYKDLHSSSIELDELIRKLKSEKMTGCIDVMLGDGIESAYLFLNSGVLFGASCSWEQSTGGDWEMLRTELFNKIAFAGGIFNVYRISPPYWLDGTERKISSISAGRPKHDVDDEGSIAMLEEFLGVFEGVVASKKGLKTEFRMLLNKKFLENANRYPFLDPFAADFHYHHRKISLRWEIPKAELAEGVIESVKELAKDLHLFPRLLNHLSAWSARYSGKLKKYHIRLDDNNTR